MPGVAGGCLVCRLDNGGIDVVDSEATGIQDIGKRVPIFASRTNNQSHQRWVGAQVNDGAHDGQIGASARADGADKVGRLESAQRIDKGCAPARGHGTDCLVV